MHYKYLTVAVILFLCCFRHSDAIKEGELKDIDKLVFYAIPHSHTDAGWYWTYSYYYNLASRILDTVTTYLGKHKDARFTWSDLSFFRKWYTEKVKGNSARESLVKGMIESGQFDLINGGLVQADEAGPNVKESYENLEEGLRFLYEEFGVTPSSLWQIDPFGFSSSSPEMLKSVGINKVVLNRMSEAYKNVLRENQDLDFIWTGDGEEEIYTHVLHDHYGVDLKFYFDKRWYASNKCPSPLNDECVVELIKESVYQGVKIHNKTGYVMQLLGNDFFFSNAEFSFDYIDGMKSAFEKLAPKHLNGAKVEFRYATLSEYFNDILPLNYTIGRYTGDFFVYTQYHPNNFYDNHWGGYFTSRPLIKWMIRDSLSHERALNSLMGVVNFARTSNITHLNEPKFWDAFSNLLNVREFSSVLLHHDAITGTHGNAVNTDYKRILQKNNVLMDKVERDFSSSLVDKSSNVNQVTEYTFYNPSLYTREEVYNITITSEHASFVDDNSLEGEIMDFYTLDQTDFKQVPNQYILFIKLKIPALGHKTVKVKLCSSETSCTPKCLPKVKTEPFTATSTITLSNSKVELELGHKSLEIISIKSKIDNTKSEINETLYKYDGMHTNSCMYLFNPAKEAQKVTLTNQNILKHSGGLVNGYQLYAHDNDFHFEKVVFLKKGDEAAHVVTQNYIPTRHDIELSFRYINTDTKNIYTGNSLSFINRNYIDVQTAKNRNLTRSRSRTNQDILGLNAYPMVDGVISTYKNGANVGFANSQTCMTHLISDQIFEFIVARSIMNTNGDKGLPERLFEKFQTHFNYKVFVRKDNFDFYTVKNVYVDQMNDPILVIKNPSQTVLLPKVEYNGGETSDLDVLSLKLNQDDRGVDVTPVMVRLRNRSHKPVSIDRFFLKYDPNESDNKWYIGFLSDVRFGFSQQVTLDQLGYKQKVSEGMKVNNTHNVLKDYRDQFQTFEQMLKHTSKTERIEYDATRQIQLKPGEIANLRIFKFEIEKESNGELKINDRNIKLMTESMAKHNALIGNDAEDNSL